MINHWIVKWDWIKFSYITEYADLDSYLLKHVLYKAHFNKIINIKINFQDLQY